MYKVAVQLVCFVLLASLFYDLLGCKRFRKTQTYKIIKQIGKSRYGKLVLKKIKKAKKRLRKCSFLPNNHCVTENQVEPCVHFLDWPLNFEMSVIFFIQNIIMSLCKTFSPLQYPNFMSFGNLMKVFKAGITVVSQKIHKLGETTMYRLMLQYGRNLDYHPDST